MASHPNPFISLWIPAGRLEARFSVQNMSASALLDKAMRLAGKRAAKTAFAFFTKEGQYIRIAHSQLKPHLKENGRWASTFRLPST